MKFMENFFVVLFFVVMAFVFYNLYLDTSAYLYTKNIRIMDFLLANKIVI